MEIICFPSSIKHKWVKLLSQNVDCETEKTQDAMIGVSYWSKSTKNLIAKELEKYAVQVETIKKYKYSTFLCQIKQNKKALLLKIKRNIYKNCSQRMCNSYKHIST